MVVSFVFHYFLLDGGLTNNNLRYDYKEMSLDILLSIWMDVSSILLMTDDGSWIWIKYKTEHFLKICSASFVVNNTDKKKQKAF